MSRLVVFVLAIVACFVLSGCGLIGTGIGAAFPKYEAVEQPAVGTQVRVMADDGTTSYGKVASESAGLVMLDDGDERIGVALRAGHRIEKKRGNHWAVGLVIGLVLDVAFTAAVVAGIATYRGPSFSFPIAGQ